MTEQPTAKRILYIQRRAPHGTIYALEGLEVALIGAAFDQEVTLAFVDDGVFQLKTGQDTGSLGSRNFSVTYGALADYDVSAILVERQSLEARGMDTQDLVSVWVEPEDNDGTGDEDDPPAVNLVRVVDSEILRSEIERSQVIFNF